MASYTCSKCGTHASSKCVNNRTIFLTDDDMWMASALEMLYSVKRQPESDEHVCNRDQLIITVNAVSHDESTASVLARLVNYIQNVPAKTFCDHNFVIDAGEECLFGCCKGVAT